MIEDLMTTLTKEMVLVSIEGIAIVRYLKPLNFAKATQQ
jgi:hypothetical protein